jgi:hypothetical protein
MRTKSAYREKPAANINPPAEAVITPAPDAPAVAAEVRPQSEPQAGSSQPDEAAAALRRQIDELRRSETMNRRAAELAVRPQQPLSREQKIELWRQQGMGDQEAEFLKQHPMMIDANMLTAYAAREALQAGHERGSETFLQETKRIFDKHIADLQTQAETPTEPAMTPTPKFFEPPPQARPRAPQGPIVSAPVSRETPGMRRAEAESDPRRVTLSIEEREIARASGISEIEYARNKIKLQGMKARGEVQ